MNYIGSKRSLLPFLNESIQKITAGKNCAVFCDLFAGTGVVGSHFKKKGFKIIANDIQYYSFVLNKNSIENHRELQFEGLQNEIPQLRNQKENWDKAKTVMDYLNRLPLEEGFLFNHYCLGGDKNQEFHRQYFSDENGKKCDSIRKKIENWKNTKKINMNEYYFLLASLLESIDQVANTASIYSAFLKSLKKTAQKTFSLQPAWFFTNDTEHEVFNEDANTVIQRIKGDILYLDPPYNHRQYCDNYHLLETIAQYDGPTVMGKTGLRNDRKKQKSNYCLKKNVLASFEDLILNANFKYIFLSYNDEGLMSLEVIKRIMSQKGKYGVLEKEYSRYKADKNRTYKKNTTTETLHYVICDSI